jgi:hypothetical protein
MESSGAGERSGEISLDVTTLFPLNRSEIGITLVYNIVEAIYQIVVRFFIGALFSRIFRAFFLNF